MLRLVKIPTTPFTLFARTDFYIKYSKKGVLCAKEKVLKHADGLLKKHESGRDSIIKGTTYTRIPIRKCCRMKKQSGKVPGESQ